MSNKQLAQAHGFAGEFAALQSLRTGKGDPQPEDLLKLPETFRREVLGVSQDSKEGLDRGLRNLIDLVDASPETECALLRLAFNFDHEYGADLWTSRVQTFAANHGGDEKTIRDKVDVAIIQMLLRTREAAEKVPEIPADSPKTERCSPVQEFFDQDYVRNSQAFAAAWTTARIVEMCGFGHNRMLVAYSAEIDSLMRAGGTVRVLLQDPEGSAVLDANFRSSTPKASKESVRHQHRAGLATLASLRNSAGNGTMLVRSYDIMPPFTAYFFDAEQDNGLAFIWFWSWRQASSWRPGFVVQKTADPLWFSRFHDQFTSMWEDEGLTYAIHLEEQ